jgi:phenylalanyl-tRNA synthetase beta chain
VKISLNWIKNFIDLDGISVDDIIAKLTMSGLEVEEVIDQIKMYKNFVVGHVIEKSKHPNADKLSFCKVSIGNSTVEVVCGAPNVAAGQKIVLAMADAIVPQSGFHIKKTKIRGVESNGMICSEAELNLSNDHSGIMVLPQESIEGEPISTALNLNDVILEIAITPNRPDALSQIGVARDIAAIFGLDVKLPILNIEKKLPSEKDITSFASIEIEDTINCPRYTAKVVTDVEVKDSPLWLKQHIEAVGLRSINNIVDVTNFILYELGQPLHAFDLDRLSGHKIIVKQAGLQKIFTTLDSKIRNLQSETLMICDGEKAVAIAGVMGGENSEVSSDTKNILIESAYFNPVSIRKTSKLLGLSTDASYRFERGTNPNITLFAVQRAAQLIQEVAGGNIVDGEIDIYPNPIIENKVQLRYERVDRILGYKINRDNICKILISLGFKLNNYSDEAVEVTVPTFRPDVEREIDLIEEIARIDGYDNIPTVPRVSIAIKKQEDETSYNDDIRDIATGLGFFEIISNSLQSEKIASITGNPIKMLNPQSADMAFLRTSLIPGALLILNKNINAGEKNLKLFEIGRVFNQTNSQISTFGDFTESEKLLFLITGKSSNKEWYIEEKFYDFFDLKGLLNSFLNKKSLDSVLNDSYNHEGNNIFEYYLTKNFNNSIIGIVGKLKKEILSVFGIDQDVFCFELSVDQLKQIPLKGKKYSELLKFPKVVRDVAFVLDKKLQYAEIENFIEKNGSKLLKNVSLFDFYEGEQLGSDKKSLAISLEYFDSEKTLTEEEVEKDFFGLIEKINKEFNAVLRG